MRRAAPALLGILLLTVTAQAFPLAELGPAPGAPVVPDAARGAALAAELLAASPGEQVRITAAQAGFAVPAVHAADLALVEGIAALAARDGHPLTQAQRDDLAARAAAMQAGLDAPAARIVSAAVAAWDLRAEAMASLSPGEQLDLAALAPLLAAGEPGVGVAAVDGATAEPTAPGLSAADRARVVALAARVDAGRMAAAEAQLADAVMASLPELQLAASDAPAVETHCPVAGSVFQFAPYLAIDGTGSCTFHDNWYVTIDLGGNDVYTNNAGGASLATVAVAVAVDVAGNDLYTKIAPGTTASTSIVVQGAAAGGIGLLVDASGSDVYDARVLLTPPPLTNPAPTATVVAQGAAATGAGALVDLMGPNTFVAVASTLGGIASTTAQGAGGLAGVGVLATGPDLSGGTPYVATATSGTLLVAASEFSRTYALGPAGTIAQGGGVAGAGALVDAAGADTYFARSNGGGDVATVAQGGATGAGLLVDGEGADAMAAIAIIDAGLVGDWPVSCPTGFICSFTGTVTVTMGSAAATAQGAADTGAALLADLGAAGGSHSTIATADPVGVAFVHFIGGGGSGGTLNAIATVSSGDARAHAQGYGALGAGVALGGLGSDVWSVRATTSATATATSTGGSTNLATATATAANAIAQGQGFANVGAGVLADPGGSDTYIVTEGSTATATRNGAPGTATAGTVTWGGRALAPGPGVAALVDAGGADTYSGVPSGLAAGGNDLCWTNSAPGLPSNLNIGLGIDIWSSGPGPLPGTCTLPPPN
jgi:hypothetical protein